MQKIKKILDIYHINPVFFRFILVGVLNTAFGYGLYCLLVFLGMTTEIAVLLSTIVGVFFNFKTTGILVFKNKDNKLIFRFIGTYMVTYFFNIGLIRLLMNSTQFNKYSAGFVSTIIVALISFILQNNFVFNSKNENKRKRKLVS